MKKSLVLKWSVLLKMIKKLEIQVSFTGLIKIHSQIRVKNMQKSKIVKLTKLLSILNENMKK